MRDPPAAAIYSKEISHQNWRSLQHPKWALAITPRFIPRRFLGHVIYNGVFGI